MLTALALLVGLTASGQGTTAAATDGLPVDVELVLAVDVSGSMDIEEAEIQRAGYVEALTHPEFLAAVKEGVNGRIAISYFEWAGTVNDSSFIPWQTISSAGQAASFAAKLAARPIASRRGTSLSAAIAYGSGLFAGNGYEGMRRVIDVSGDGPNNFGAPVTPARDAATALGIVINGLAITIRPSSAYGPLDEYYAACVIGGPGAFVLAVQEPEDFAIAIRRKLIIEVSGRDAPARLLRASDRTDCLIGEKLRPGFSERYYPELDK
ncbi:DUF1194 domain-containing protein [Sinorhizobium sp. BG8]|uniref:DUF1194 domain-containing protein n=1 Tax=Sinorhizobium sp. BG8 TaxID=2613773 RepID=UPI00193CC419|nr:DUF1194 domain-containing protein [Sinorhizobium sp. BG8]QRM55934.1 DUF1194 domain-containing protein [Sinorhizobium sp. BG8]